MFDTILIANRGEIACRVITTARWMGIRTVAVFSDADATAAHVAMADVAVQIGPAAVAQSYLKGQAIIQAALDTGAQAIHPGYGFLSENPGFVEDVEAAGLVFIGPSAAAIRAMGLKDAAKTLMAQSGVPVVPGYHGSDQDPKRLADAADKIGYPVLIKARAGGGGKGMRLVERPADFATALQGAQREGLDSFGDGAVLVEKYITTPRHIEVQVFGDTHGNIVHMFERDCSLQRRHQKVIEEAPAPGMTPAMRAAMGTAAVNAARAVGYHGAGTVEFIVDGAGGLRQDRFWFMEMNTRLQVEHPVTEAITGLDLVELQLRVAAGEPLPFAQSDLSITGHAFEARVYAEDVPKGFLPSTGTLNHITFPHGARFGPGPVRIDSAVGPGDTITPFYDPMIAKVITHAPTRAEALRGLTQALKACHIAGSVTNVDFLVALSRDADFASGHVDTGLIARTLPELATEVSPSDRVRALALVLSSGLLLPPNPADPWDSLRGWRHWSPQAVPVSLIHQVSAIQSRITVLGGGGFQVDERIFNITPTGDHRFTLKADGQTSVLFAVRHAYQITVFDNGHTYTFTVPDPLADAGADGAGADSVLAPMPGLVKQVYVTTGASVAKGAALLVIEAMKMEHTLTAPRDGTVAEILTDVGDQVVDGATLVSFEVE